jgi:hypothetical protein
VQCPDAEEAEVGADAAERLDRRRAHRDHGAPVERAADRHHLEPRPPAQRGGDRRAVGHERAGVARRDRVDEVQRGAAAVEDHHLARLEQRRGGAGGGDLAVHGLHLAALVGARHRRARQRAAAREQPARDRVEDLVDTGSPMRSLPATSISGSASASEG